MILNVIAGSLFILLLVCIYKFVCAILVRIRRLLRKRITSSAGLYLNNYVDSKAFYLYRFAEVPCVTFINEIDVNKASDYVRTYMSNEIVGVFQHNQYSYETSELHFNVSIFVLTDGRMIELGNNYAEILYGNRQYGFANELVRQLAAFRLEVEMPVTDVFRHVEVSGFIRRHEMN